MARNGGIDTDAGMSLGKGQGMKSDNSVRAMRAMSDADICQAAPGPAGFGGGAAPASLLLTPIPLRVLSFVAPCAHGTGARNSGINPSVTGH